VDVPKGLIPDFAMAIRSTDESVAVENSCHILEVDLVVTQVRSALLRVLIKSANLREQLFQVFRHSEAP
jgi:hypothetical protein